MMTIYSIGRVDPQATGEQQPVEWVQVEADSADSPITRVINTGDRLAFDMAHEQIERLQNDPEQDEYSVPSPRNVAAGILGRGATVTETSST